LNEVSFDVNVLGFALAVSVLSAFVFGLVPALQVSRQRPAETLRDGARAGTSRQRLRAALTIVEVAISVALLIGAGLLLRSFGRLQAVQPGFDIGPLMTMRTTLPRATYKTSAQMSAFYERLLADARTQPGIVAVATSSGVPLTLGNTSTTVTLLHRQPKAGEQLAADWRLVSPGYFATMGIPLLGRDFTTADRANTQLVTIISEEMARRYWGNEDPIGKPVIIGSFDDEVPHTIIGVAGDVRSFGLDAEPAPMVYGSAIAYGGWNPMDVVWRSAVDPQSHVPALREAVRKIDPSIGIFNIRSLPELLSESFGPRRFNMYLLGIFAGVALLLAAIGLFGVMAYLVAQRTREIGVRVALGANRADILRLVLARGMLLTLGGAAIGLLGAVWLTRTMESLLFSISPNDPTTFIAVPTVLVVVAFAASYVPVRRALQVDPTIALRAE
jgi:putative ABC transport system permease protein